MRYFYETSLKLMLDVCVCVMDVVEVGKDGILFFSPVDQAFHRITGPFSLSW
jgi:hypothetical protein